MMKEKASIEASLHVLKQEKEATAASREAAIFEEGAAAVGYEGKDTLGELQDLALEDPIKRTKDYIETQQFDTHAPQELQDAMPLSTLLHPETVKTRPSSNKAQDSLCESIKEETERRPITGECYNRSPAPKVFLSKHKYSLSTPQNPDLAQYLMRREIMSSGLLAFDDCPENYWAWKASFTQLHTHLRTSKAGRVKILHLL